MIKIQKRNTKNYILQKIKNKVIKVNFISKKLLWMNKKMRQSREICVKLYIWIKPYTIFIFIINSKHSTNVV